MTTHRESDSDESSGSARGLSGRGTSGKDPNIPVRARDVSLIYRDHGREIRACDAVSLDIHAGEFLGILGPSGSGKSSLLYLLSGLKNPTEGVVALDGQPLSTLSDRERSAIRLREFGFVFQQPYLLGYISALENVLAVCPPRDAACQERARELLRVLGLETKMERRPHELSGGERQRVCVARALVMRPRVVFADEPTAALDGPNGRIVVELLAEHRGEGALVMVTHDPTMLARADRIIRIVEGKVADSEEMESSRTV